MTRIEKEIGFDRDEYEGLKSAAIEDGIHVLHVRRFGDAVFSLDSSRFGGATVAWRRAGFSARSKMIEVSVSWCSPKDVFCRRIGSFQALGNFYEGNTILLPIGDEDNSEVVFRLRGLFGMMQ